MKLKIEFGRNCTAIHDSDKKDSKLETGMGDSNPEIYNQGYELLTFEIRDSKPVKLQITFLNIGSPGLPTIYAKACSVLCGQLIKQGVSLFRPISGRLEDLHILIGQLWRMTRML